MVKTEDPFLLHRRCLCRVGIDHSDNAQHKPDDPPYIQRDVIEVVLPVRFLLQPDPGDQGQYPRKNNTAHQKFPGGITVIAKKKQACDYGKNRNKKG